MNKFLILVSVLFFFRYSYSQEFLGVRNSNYAGMQSVFLNPASMVNTKTKWDISLVSAGMFIDNDFFYIPRRQVSPFGFKKMINGIKDNRILSSRYDPQNPNRRYQLVSSGAVIGPSFYLPLNPVSKIGFTIAVRGYTDFHEVPGHVAQNAYKNLRDPGLWNTPWEDHSTKFNSMSWLEYGLHYGRVLYQTAGKELNIGFNLKYLQGITVAYTKNTNLAYSIADSNTFILSHSALDYGGTQDFPDRRLRNLVHGNGLSESIGFTYIFLRDPGCNANMTTDAGNVFGTEYSYKIGISLIDFGFINFNRHSSAYHLQTDSATYSGIGQSSASENTGLQRSLTDILYQNDSIKHITANSVHMALPSAVSIQADWNIYNHYYLNATIIKGLGHAGKPGVIRPDLYSITPRYESAWFEASLPVSLLYYGHWQPRIGVAFRIGYLFFGGDAPGGLSGIADLERADVYAGIHYFPLERKHRSKYLQCLVSRY